MITTIDPSLAVRGKIIAALKSDAELVAIVPASRVYPGKSPASPTWPFIRVPILAGTFDGLGSSQSGVVHCFTKLSATNPDPEAQAATINRHIARILGEIDGIDVGDDLEAGIHVRQTQTLADPVEADAYHGIVQIEALAT